MLSHSCQEIPASLQKRIAKNHIKFDWMWNKKQISKASSAEIELSIAMCNNIIGGLSDTKEDLLYDNFVVARGLLVRELSNRLDAILTGEHKCRKNLLLKKCGNIKLVPLCLKKIITHLFGRKQ